MTDPVHISLSDRIRLNPAHLPDEVTDALMDALTIPNKVKEEQKEQHVWGWERLADDICLYRLEENAFSFPRGFLHDLETGMDQFGLDLAISDERQDRKVFRTGRDFDYREHQGPAVKAILDNEQGIYKAPAGSGKTATILGAGRDSQRKCIIIVNTIDVQKQWVERIHQFLGENIDVGLIGGGKFSVGLTWTIATAQTLSTRFETLENEGFFDRFGFVCVDECHHTQSDTYLKVLDRFTAQYRIGVSATPDKTGDFTLAKMVLGPLIHITKHDGLVEGGLLVNPEVMKVNTDFNFNFVGATSRWKRSNYGDLVEALIHDEKRNDLIVSCIMREKGHHCLLITKRLEHIEILTSKLLEAGWDYPIYRLTGKDKPKDREAAIAGVAAGPSIMLSTLADEALDVPMLDRLYLAFPQKNVGLVQQQTGRVERSHPEKKNARIYDFVDRNVGPLRNQWKKRLYQVYKTRGFEMTLVDVAEA